MFRRLALSLPRDQAIGTSTTLTRCYATPAKGGSAASKQKAQKSTGPRGSRGGEGAADSRVDLIKKTLYDSDPSDEARLAALAKVVPSPEVHETITRAWQLFVRHRRQSHASELARKYTSMRSAIDLLETTDKGLWEKAVGGRKFQNVDQRAAREGNARLIGLVPRELRPPMEQPGARMWDGEWKAPKVAKAE